MIIDKTLKAAAYFTAEGNIRPTLRGVFIQDGKVLATNSFIACSFKLNLKGRPEIEHSEYPEIGLKEVNLSKPISLDGSFLKKLKFKANLRMPGIFQNTLLMGELQKGFVHFGKTDLENTEILGTRKIQNGVEGEAPKCPDIDGFIRDAELKTEVSVNVDYMIEILKAFKLKGTQNVNIGVGACGLNDGAAALQPVLIGDPDNEDDKAIIMPLKMDLIFKNQLRNGK